MVLISHLLTLQRGIKRGSLANLALAPDATAMPVNDAIHQHSARAPFDKIDNGFRSLPSSNHNAFCQALKSAVDQPLQLVYPTLLSRVKGAAKACDDFYLLRPLPEHDKRPVS